MNTHRVRSVDLTYCLNQFVNDLTCFLLSIVGLYRVVKYWQACGLSGFMVYKFALKRCEDQAPPPWEQTSEDSGSDISDSINGSIN